MVRNPDRRRLLADAAVAVLANEGARGLTHRALDAHTGLPAGTAGNYFPTRTALIAALVDRIGERLSPDPEILSRLGARAPGRALFADYLRDIVRRLSADRDAALALFELRLDATRRPEIAAILTGWQRASFDADVAFNRAAGLPGGPREIALFHYAIDGLLFDRLTHPIDPETTTDAVIDALVAGLLPDPVS